jgi:Aminoglycoside-2''-adenylyltransferase
VSETFDEVRRVGALLGHLRCEWYVCGGWALDLFLGRVTRSHKDVDVAVARRDQLEVQGYLRRRGWNLEKAADGRLSPWAEGEELRLPLHAVWCRNEAHDPDFFELLLNEIGGELFRFRRDPTVTLPRARISFESPAGLPVLAPEVVLLYKSNSPEESGEDFRHAAPALSEGARAWLKGALDKVSPGHRWASEL